MIDRENFHKRLQALMEQHEMTQSDLAAEIWGRVKNTKGVDVARGRDRISVWLSGKNFPSPEMLKQLAKALNVKPGDLMPGGRDAGPGSSSPA